MAEGRLFGTDGVRGRANVDLTADLALRLGRAAGSFIPGGTVLVGRDTRRSGEMLSLAVQAGFHSAGVDTVDVGILPSGGISHLTATTSADMGVVVSASHNPAPDNGIKLLDAKGMKLPDAEEDRIEERLRDAKASRIPFGEAVGTRFPMDDAVERYVGDLAAGSAYSFRGISVVLDCANGAAFRAAPALFSRLKADVSVIEASPDGVNINAGCGATNPGRVAEAAEGRIGLAFDGDADRLIATDEDGRVVNGDAVMAVIVRHWRETGKLARPVLVTTVMSNLGLRLAMEAIGVEVVETRVGDRYVLEEMRRRKAVVGGEQSGHVIFLDRGRTGDGLLTAIRLLEVVAGTGRELRELRAEAITELPQVLENVRVRDRGGLEGATGVWRAVAEIERKLGRDGRVLVRPSGTEPLVRVMVEALDEAVAREYAGYVASAVAAELGVG